MKIILIDTETTGLSATDNDVIQIGAIVRIDNIIICCT